MADEPHDDSDQLDERKATVLRAVVSTYIETAQPVGSGHVARTPGVEVSPATVRNDMSALEQEGYLHQPHTSAGRVPTDKGYRFFVDRLSAASLATADSKQVRSFFAEAHGELEQMLADTSRLLANLTQYAAVVVSPPVEAATVRSVQLVGLAPRVALVVVVLSNGAVDKHTIEFGRDIDDAALAVATARLSARLTGEPLTAVAAVAAELAGETSEATAAGAQPDDLADAELAARRVAVDVLSHEHALGEHVYIGGAGRMASAFDAVATVSEVLGILEQQYVVVSLLQDVLDRGLHVAIGTETGIAPLADCSVVVAPYAVEGEPVGTIGVLGPTRMNYPQALAAVAVVGQRLGRHLSEG
jgi:heat-inducible transcriptional repressor